MALTGGGLWLAATNGADISLETALLIVLALCGAGLVVGSFVGRARPLIGLAIPLTFAVVAASAIDVPLEGGVGDRSYTPVESSQLEDEYRLAVGEIVLDLRELDVEDLRGTTTEIEASIGMGSLQVLVPRDVTIRGSARAQIGDVDVRGESQSGTSAEQRIRIAGEEGAGVLELDLRVGVGEIRVR
jgi:predicted membrane protein